MSKRVKIFLLMSSLALFSSCGKNKSSANSAASSDGSGSSQRVYTESLSSDSVMSQGCLNAGLFFESLSYIVPETSVLVVPTALSFSPESKTRENFKKFIAYGQMLIQSTSFSGLDTFPVATQDGCEKFVIKEIDGSEKEFDIRLSTPITLVGKAKDGEGYSFTWLNEHNVSIKHTYLAFDMPCSTSKDPIEVSITKNYDWSAPSPSMLVPELGNSPQQIDPAFLNLAAAAVLADPASFYVVDETGSRALDLQKVGEIAQKDPDLSLLSCGM